MIQIDKAEVIEVLVLAASAQWGIISTAQAERESVSRVRLGRLASEGVIERDRQGVYFMPSVGYGPLLSLCSAWVSLDPALYPDERWSQETLPAVVSHESAALVHGIGDLIPAKHFFISQKPKQTTQKDIRIHLRRDITRAEVTLREGLPVTSVVRTVADLADKGIEFDYLATIISDALKKGDVEQSELEEALNAHAASYGFDNGRHLLGKSLALNMDQRQTEDAVATSLGVLPYLSPEVFRSIEEQIPGSIPFAVSAQQSKILESLRGDLFPPPAIWEYLDKTQGAMNEIMRDFASRVNAFANPPAIAAALAVLTGNVDQS
ncbi:type IV toxin-antitoxin system AbiEi family antitoxin domain-containing protein [Corynebacterium pilosum]|uniref:AbiEi antitoxin N-terminal domain-containing protein n=1 Tax=Corynebacterium pilosum TaxID=35756 RepID=A0A376CLQ1_9CORY|nr:type IV toxin-antitoxin system AbiEi family antitoxin domain-containing protein [Corynebacterium pilosum]STC69147.1 Uncharacterised protein [Corynebacterium pilosum]